MTKKIKFFYYYLKNKIRNIYIKKLGIRQYLKIKQRYVGCDIKTANDINKIIYNKIESGEPFLVARFGATELSSVRTFDFKLESKYNKILEQLHMWSGFFPIDVKYGKNFAELMINSMLDIDVLGIWLLPFEEYYIKNRIKTKPDISYLLDIEPWSTMEKPWSSALKGKKVLIIHPFEDTIRSQYSKREKIFANTEILPEFDLKTLKAVQTVAGQNDERFNTWFDALEYMYSEAMKIDFDIAIIGCGAYGLPLASKIKEAGKQAIHLGGATQILFGIKGKRWEEVSDFEYVRKYFNDSWVYPCESEKPKNAKKVEDGCYW